MKEEQAAVSRCFPFAFNTQGSGRPLALLQQWPRFRAHVRKSSVLGGNLRFPKLELARGRGPIRDVTALQKPGH